MPEEVELAVKWVIQGVNSFADEMRAAGIHVGLNGSCVCGEPWSEQHGVETMGNRPIRRGSL